MKKMIVLASVLVATTNVYSSTDSHWGYSGHEGPEHWVELSGKNASCAGKSQSPINLTGFVDVELAPIQFNYKPGGESIVNNGHTIQINYEKGSSITVDGTQYNLLQFHFHSPSENHINGKSFPMEAHFVHADKDGNLAVVAVMFELGHVENPGLATAWDKLPKHVGETVSLCDKVDANAVLPVNRDYYSFSGSLTTPPCTEGVHWLVMKNPVTVTEQQIFGFSHLLHEPNNRPIQATNSRTISE